MKESAVNWGEEEGEGEEKHSQLSGIIMSTAASCFHPKLIKTTTTGGLLQLFMYALEHSSSTIKMKKKIYIYVPLFFYHAYEGYN